MVQDFAGARNGEPTKQVHAILGKTGIENEPP
jgi:hypothetical protein